MKGMKRVIFALLIVVLAFPLSAEVRLRVKTEFYNTFMSLSGIDGDWSYMMAGEAGLSFMNKSRAIRGELSLDLTEVAGTLYPSLYKLYIRPSFGDVQVSVGKTRTTWGAGLAFNAGDIIFGSDTVSFDITSSDPRTETAWLTAVEIPLGDFSFFEIIALPGSGSLGSEEVSEYVFPTIQDASVGGRISLELGDFNIQGGYLYRNEAIASLGSEGQRAFVSLEGIVPVDWHLSASAATDIDAWDIEVVKDSTLITGGASYDHYIGEYGDISLGWRLEFLIRPYGTFEITGDDSSPDGLYLYPTLTLVPPGNLGYSMSAVVSPIDISASATAGVSWRIYEELTLLGYYSVQLGEADDTFNLDNLGGMAVILGGSYSY